MAAQLSLEEWQQLWREARGHATDADRKLLDEYLPAAALDASISTAAGYSIRLETALNAALQLYREETRLYDAGLNEVSVIHLQQECTPC